MIEQEIRDVERFQQRRLLCEHHEQTCFRPIYYWKKQTAECREAKMRSSVRIQERFLLTERLRLIDRVL